MRSSARTASSSALGGIRPEWLLVCLALGLTVLGFLMQASIGRAFTGGLTTYAGKQLIWFAGAVVAFLVTLRIDFEALREFVWPIAVVGLIGLGSVLIFGDPVNGARRWIQFSHASIQTSEFAKVVFVFVFAHYLASAQRHKDSFNRFILFPGLLAIVPIGLLALQPDYGTAAFFAALAGALLFLAGARMRYLVPIGVSGLLALAVAIMLSPERLGRLLAVIDLDAHKAGDGYQLHQGLIALGNGGVTGVGLGQGRQQFTFLPEAQTDFIFAVVGEELGLPMTLLVVGAFLAFGLIGMRSLRHAPNLFQFLLAAGTLLAVCGQALINFGVATGLLPTKGMSLPFVSYGGSNLVALFIFLAILVGCFRRWRSSIVFGPGGQA